MTLDRFIRGDRYIWLIVVVLSLFSVLAIYTSTGTLAYKYQQGNTEYYLIKHFTILLLGLLLMYATYRVRYTVFSKISGIALVVIVPLLLYTLVSGTRLNEASRWLTLPLVNLSFQTSDLAKLALILFVARTLSKKQDVIKDFRKAFLPLMIPVCLVCILIMVADFSTAAILFTTCLFLMFIGRVNLKYIFMMIGGGLAVVLLLALILQKSGISNRFGTVEKRIETFVSDDDQNNYQARQAKIAVATGGILGKGPGHSTQRNFLPHPYSDFIYAIIVEEYGLLGGLVIVLLYLVLFYRALLIVRRTPFAFATFLAIGCSFSLVFQALINMAVAVNLLPVTGQPLPMLSMGGTSIWFTSIAIGIILSVSRDLEKEKRAVRYVPA